MISCDLNNRLAWECFVGPGHGIRRVVDVSCKNNHVRRGDSLFIGHEIHEFAVQIGNNVELHGVLIQ